MIEHKEKPSRQVGKSASWPRSSAKQQQREQQREHVQQDQNNIQIDWWWWWVSALVTAAATSTTHSHTQALKSGNVPATTTLRLARSA